MLLRFTLTALVLLGGCAPRYLAYGELDEDALRELVEATVRVRGLHPKGPVRFGLKSREELAQRSEGREPPALAAHPRSRMLHGLGIIDGAASLPEARAAFVRSGLGFGFYSHRDERVWIVDSGVRSDLLELVYAFRRRDPMAGGLVHEITHVLQDQHFDLERFRGQAPSTDVRMARVALVEGDANLTRLYYDDFLAPSADAALFELLVGGEGARSASGYLERMARFHYAAGQRFVAALHADGGFARVNAAFEAPPRSSLEVLHPDLYAARVSLEAVEPPQPEGELVDTLGAIHLGMFLDGLASAEETGELVRGWRGDRAILSRAQVAWRVAFADPALAARFAKAAATRCPNPAVEGRVVTIGCRP